MKLAEVMRKPGVEKPAEECGKFDHTCVLCPEIRNGVSSEVLLRLPEVRTA